MSEINIRMLAKELGLSISTVSKALNDSHEISIDTKAKVRLLAGKLQYTPNPYASSLRKKKSNTIAVVVPEVADSFFSLAIKGIETVAQEKGYHVLVYFTSESFTKEQAILHDFQSGRVDGVLMSVSSETTDGTHIQELMATKKPIVFFDRAMEEINTAKVTTNDFQSAFQATEHLIKRGCKNISFLSISKHLSINNSREKGFRAAMETYNIPITNTNVVACCNDMNETAIILKNILQPANRPDGIIASVEKLITVIYLVCKELSLDIPTDIKLIGFTNLECAPILNPSLTTITQPAFEMGKTAAKLLFKALEKKNYNVKDENIIMPSLLIERDSTFNQIGT